MPEKFFLALDYKEDNEVLEHGTNALFFLDHEFGHQLKERLGVKLNEDVLTGRIDPRFRKFAENGYDVFADMKICHGADTGERIIERLTSEGHGNLPIKYVTVSAGLGSEILRKYVDLGRSRGIDVIAFTVHTKIPAEEVTGMYAGENVNDAISNLGQVAYRGGCHAIVLEGDKLKDPRIRDLPLKKLVTGIRIDPTDRGSQSRVTALGDLQQVKDHVDYVVVSSKYVDDEKKLANYFAALL